MTRATCMSTLYLIHSIPVTYRATPEYGLQPHRLYQNPLALPCLAPASSERSVRCGDGCVDLEEYRVRTKMAPPWGHFFIEGVPRLRSAALKDVESVLGLRLPVANISTSVGI
jgi:hypothetical protein